MKHYREIMVTAFSEMPDIFTSFEFGEILRDKGVPLEYTTQNIAHFLRKRCGRASKYVWDKARKPDSYKKPISKNVTKGYRKELIDALASMPSQFTSSSFIRECVNRGVERRMMQNSNMTSDFLKANCKRITYRTWGRKGAVTSFLPELKPVTSSHELTVEDCVNFLKNKGYKIMKPVSEWVEL